MAVGFWLLWAALPTAFAEEDEPWPDFPEANLEERLAGSELASQLLLQVHDELVLEVPLKQLDETREIVRRSMEEAVVLDVPLQVDFGHGANWLEAH